MSNIFLPPGLIPDNLSPCLVTKYARLLNCCYSEREDDLKDIYEWVDVNIFNRSTYYLRRCMLYLMRTTSDAPLYQYEDERNFAVYVLNLIDEELARRGK